MKFIFPKNYNFKDKLFGIIEYKVLFFNIIWSIFIFCLLNLLFKNITLKISLFIIFCLPVFFLTTFGFNHENIFTIIICILKFLFCPKIYVFLK
jgi:hypothetical protein